MLSAHVDKKLHPYAQECNSCIKDTTHFLQLIKDLKIQPSTILVTVGVSSLCTNIPHKDGTASIRQCLENHKEDPQDINFTCQLLEHILTKNYFMGLQWAQDVHQTMPSSPWPH